MNDGSGDNYDIVDKTKLIVNYIPQGTTEKDLALIFSQIGMIESVRIMKNYKTGYSYGYGFVKYFNAPDAAKAIESINGLNYRSKRLKVSYSRPPGHAMKDSNLYISNLPKDFSERDLEQLFGAFGEIIQKNVLKDKHSGLPRGVAFVRFSKGEEAQEAIASLHGKRLATSQMPLLVRVADDHSKQKALILPMDIFKTNLINAGYVTTTLRPPPPPPGTICHHQRSSSLPNNNHNNGNTASALSNGVSNLSLGNYGSTYRPQYNNNNGGAHGNHGGARFPPPPQMTDAPSVDTLGGAGGGGGGGDSKYTHASPHNYW